MFLILKVLFVKWLEKMGILNEIIFFEYLKSRVVVV